MCGLAQLLCLVLWIVGAAVSTAQGPVTTHARVNADVGLPLTLGCNITTPAGASVRQVRWLNQHDKVLLAYGTRESPKVFYQEPGVEMTPLHNDDSSITIKSVKPEDEGCYRCTFDVFPLGPQHGQTCIQIIGRVKLVGNKTVVSGMPTTLSCLYSLPKKVRQVLWKKTAEQGDTTTVAHYSGRSQPSVKDAFQGRVTLSRTLGETQLAMQRIRTEDEGCYTCEFHTFPDGTKSAIACLSVYVLPNPEVSYVTTSQGITEANCTAQSRPAAEILWDFGEDNRTYGPPISSAYDQGDGTTIVTSTLIFQSALLSDGSVKCIVRHPGLEKPLSVSLNKRVEPAMVILLSVCGVATVLLLCLCVCLCKCFICTED